MINTKHSPAFQHFKNFQHFQNKYKQSKINTDNTKAKAFIGAAIGTAIPLAFMLKSQKTKNPLNLDYKLKDILVLSTSSIAGGTLFGMHKQHSHTKKTKLKEGVFQILNATLPALGVSGMLKLCEKQKINNTPCKIGAVVSGIAIGMFTAIKSTNKIFDPKDIHPDRKLGPKDFIASADDAIGALALGKFPIVQSLRLDKALPLAFGYCGYRAGKAE